MNQPPRDSQWAAIRDTDHHLLVTAGAGTGKTFTVVGKVLYLLGVPVRNESCAAQIGLADIAAITYTNQAAADLKRKLREELRAANRRQIASDVDDARIGTIHAFCGDILREFALRGDLPPALRILTEDESRTMLAEIARDTIVAAIELESVPHVNSLVVQFPLRDITNWVAKLAADTHRLEQLTAGRSSLGPRECALLDLAGTTQRALQHRLRQDSSMDFHRMIAWARDLIRDVPGVCSALRRRIRVLIVDEFQDVDPIQKEIAYLLADPLSRRTDTPRLMLVGDPKQSIYAFRGADVTVWNQVHRDFTDHGCGAVLNLADNFRSVAPILAFVGATIGTMLDVPVQGSELQDFEVEFHAVQPTRTDGPTDHAVEFIVVPAVDGGAPSADRMRACEAEGIARRMLELHEHDHATWRDMAVLLNAWTDLATYQSALHRAGIPSYALREEGFTERREVLDLMLALQVMRDPRNDTALLGFLRGPFVGVKDETLLALTLDAAPPLHDTVPPADCPEHERVADAFALIARYAALRDRIPAADLLRRLLEETGYLAHLALLGDDGLQPFANVRKFLRMLETYGDENLGDFLRRLQELRDGASHEGDARLYGSTDDVVTLTSIHSAKGLEWKIVFWCDLARARSMRTDTGKLLIGRDVMVLGHPDVTTAQQPDGWRALHAALAAESAAEDKRVWYVASTRAKDRLILSGIPQGEWSYKSSVAAALRAWRPVLESTSSEALSYEGLGATFAAPVHVAPVVAEPDPRAPVEMGAVLPIETLAQPRTPVAVPAGRGRFSATELLAWERCPKKHWFKYVAGLQEPAVDRDGVAYTNALVRGQIVHDVLERYDDGSDLDALLDDAMERVRGDAFVSAAQRRRCEDEARAEILRAEQSPAYRAIAGLPTAQRELRFLYIANEHAVAEGAMDLAAATPDGLVILDVKTSRGDADVAARKAEEYSPQRDVYVAAAEGISGLPVHRFAFHFTASDTQLGATLTEEDRAHARNQFVQRTTAAVQPDPPLTRFPHECTFCGYRKAGWCEGLEPVAGSW
ncbi:MAG: UvrD-helicase domain-containing protein [Gemmatimonadaceae bacterium]